MCTLCMLILDVMPGGDTKTNQTKVQVAYFHMLILKQCHFFRASIQNIIGLLVLLLLLCLLHGCLGHFLGKDFHNGIQFLKHPGLPGMLLLPHQKQDGPGAEPAKALVAVVCVCVLCHNGPAGFE